MFLPAAGKPMYWFLTLIEPYVPVVLNVITVLPRKRQHGDTALASAELSCGGSMASALVTSVPLNSWAFVPRVWLQPQYLLLLGSFSFLASRTARLAGASTSILSAGVTPKVGVPQTSSESCVCSGPLIASPVMNCTSVQGGAGLNVVHGGLLVVSLYCPPGYVRGVNGDAEDSRPVPAGQNSLLQFAADQSLKVFGGTSLSWVSNFDVGRPIAFAASEESSVSYFV